MNNLIELLAYFITKNRYLDFIRCKYLFVDGRFSIDYTQSQKLSEHIFFSLLFSDNNSIMYSKPSFFLINNVDIIFVDKKIELIQSSDELFSCEFRNIIILLICVLIVSCISSQDGSHCPYKSVRKIITFIDFFCFIWNKTNKLHSIANIFPRDLFDTSFMRYQNSMIWRRSVFSSSSDRISFRIFFWNTGAEKSIIISKNYHKIKELIKGK